MDTGSLPNCKWCSTRLCPGPPSIYYLSLNLVHIFRQFSNFHSYADDTQLYLPTSFPHWLLTSWSSEKTVVLLLGTKTVLDKCLFIYWQFSKGVVFSSTLICETHINNITLHISTYLILVSLLQVFHQSCTSISLWFSPSCTLRSSSFGTLVIASAFLTTVDFRAFTRVAPHLWNAFPHQICNIGFTTLINFPARLLQANQSLFSVI